MKLLAAKPVEKSRAGVRSTSLLADARPAGYPAAMQAITVFHNPRCSKSRRAVEILGERGAAFTTVEYLHSPPDRETLERIVALLPTPPTSLVRRDSRFAELGFDDAACATAAQVVSLLLAHPELMERPVVVAGDRALIARPPEKVLDLLD